MPGPAMLELIRAAHQPKCWALESRLNLGKIKEEVLMPITGTDNEGRLWTGEVHLEVLGRVLQGSIKWSGKRKFRGIEKVKGSFDDGVLDFKGIDVSGSIVKCHYHGTWKDGEINLEWTPLKASPGWSGNAKGSARLILTTQT
jgi:hypothetical protein